MIKTLNTQRVNGVEMYQAIEAGARLAKDLGEDLKYYALNILGLSICDSVILVSESLDVDINLHGVSADDFERLLNMQNPIRASLLLGNARINKTSENGVYASAKIITTNDQPNDGRLRGTEVEVTLFSTTYPRESDEARKIRKAVINYRRSYGENERRRKND